MVEFIVVDGQYKSIDNLICYQTMLDFNVDFNEIFNSGLYKTVYQINQNNDPLYFTGSKLKTYVLNHWKNIFEKTVGEVPYCEYEPIKLLFDINKKQIKCPSQIIPTHMLAPTKEKVDQWQNYNILTPIEYSDEITWISSLNPVEKSHGKPEGSKLTVDDIRLTCNFRNLNNAIISEVVSVLPDQRQIKYDLNGSLIFSKLDIRDAFSCLKFDEETSKHMVFSTPWGLYKLNRLAQGINVASAIFQNFMVSKFKDIKGTKQCIDDSLIYGKPDYADIGTNKAMTSAIRNHNDALFKSLDRMEKLNLTLNSEKCQFGVESVSFYGNEISAKGTRPLQAKIDAFKTSKNPTNKSELKSLQGMCAHFSEILPNKCNLTSGLSELAKKYTDFKWTEQHSNEVQALKDSLITKYMAHYDTTLASELYVDAGPHGIAAILTQVDKNGKKWLISCGSHSFSEIENRFSQVEKEALAIVWSLLHFKNELICNDNFTIMSDNEAIVKLLNRHAKIKPSTPLRILSWLSKITGFTYKIQHIPGKNNIADYLSRCHNEEKSTRIFEELKSVYQINKDSNNLIQSIHDNENGITIDEIKEHQFNDSDLIDIINAIEHKTIVSKTNPYFKIFNKISIHQQTNLLILNNRIILPQSLINKVISTAHSGHIGIDKCLEIIKRRYMFNKLNQKIKQFISKCPGCNANTGSTTTAPMIITNIPNKQWQLCSIDFSSKLPNNSYILVLVCERTRYPIMKISKNLTAKSAIEILKKIFLELEQVPREIKSDNGPAFIAHDFANFAEQYGFIHTKVTPLWPNANGLCENKMKIINKSVRVSNALAYNDIKQPWQIILDNALKTYRAARHASTGYSPNELLGKEDDIGLPHLTFEPVDEAKLKQNDLRAKIIYKHYNDTNKHAKNIIIKENDFVLHKWNPNNKYQPRYDPIPYKLIQLNGTMATVKRPNEKPLTRNISFFKKFDPPSINQVNITCNMVLFDPLALYRAKIQAEREAVERANATQQQPESIQTQPATASQQNVSNPTTSNQISNTSTTNTTTNITQQQQIELNKQKTKELLKQKQAIELLIQEHQLKQEQEEKAKTEQDIKDAEALSTKHNNIIIENQQKQLENEQKEVIELQLKLTQLQNNQSKKERLGSAIEHQAPILITEQIKENVNKEQAKHSKSSSDLQANNDEESIKNDSFSTSSSLENLNLEDDPNETVRNANNQLPPPIRKLATSLKNQTTAHLMNTEHGRSLRSVSKNSSPKTPDKN
jgi:hypothetical protein